MATNPLRCAQSLVGPARRGWTPEEAARYEVALLRGLASDKKAQRVFLRKVRVVELVRAGGQPDATWLGAHTKPLDKTAAVAGGHSSMPGQPLGTAAEPRARRRKSEAQRQKSVEKLQHKKLQSRCEAAATKVGGSPPNVLARVLACCGRFLELLHPDGAARMKRLRQAEALCLSKVDAVDKGLNAMRSALASAAAPTSRMDVEKGQWPPVGGLSSRPSPFMPKGHRPGLKPGLGDSSRSGEGSGWPGSYLREVQQPATSVASPGIGGASKPVGEPPTTRRASSPKR